MTTLQNTTYENVISKTSFKQDGLEAELLIALMTNGFTFITSFKLAKQLS